MKQKYSPHLGHESSGLRDVLTIIFKHKGKFLVTFLLIVITVTVGSFMITPTYEAKSSLLFKFGREYIYRPEVGEKGQGISPMISFNQAEVINSEIEILLSRNLAEMVINLLGLETIYPGIVQAPPENMTPLEAALQVFQNNLSSAGLKKSNVLEIKFKHKDPEIAAETVNSLVDFFKERHLQIYDDPQSAFLGKQLASYEEKLQQSADELQAFKQKHNVFSLVEQRNLLLRQHTELDTLLKDNQNQTRALQIKLSSLKKEMNTIYENIDRYTESDRYRIIDDAKSKLLTFQLREQELLEKYTETNRLVVNIRKEIQIVRDFLKEQEANIRTTVKSGNIVYQEVEKEMIKTSAELRSLETKSSSLMQQLDDVKATLQNLDLREKELQKLQRALSLNERNYKVYLNKYEEARITEDMNRRKLSNISVIQKATAPAKPVKPRKLINIIISIMLGSFAGLGFAFLSEHMSQGLVNPETIEKRLALPVLVSVPRKN